MTSGAANGAGGGYSASRPAGLLTLRRANETLSQSADWVAAAVLLITFVLLILQVISRFVIAIQVFWLEEVARMCFVWVVLIATGAATWRSDHVSVTAIADKLPERVGRVLDFLTDALVAATAAVLLVASVEIALRLINVTTSSGGISRSVFYVAGIIGFALVLFHTVSLAVLEKFGMAPARRLGVGEVI